MAHNVRPNLKPWTDVRLTVKC